MKNINRSTPYVILLGLMFASHMVVSRFSIGQFAPLPFVALRLLLCSIIYLTIILPVRKHGLPRDLKLWRNAGIMGILSTALPLIGFVAALQYMSSGVVSLLATLNTALTVILAQLFLHDEPLSWNKILGIIVAFSGAALLLINGETGIADLEQADWRGYALTGLSVLGLSSGNIIVRRFLKTEDAFDIIGIRLIVATIICLPLAGLVSGFDLSSVQTSGYVALIFTAIVGTLFAFLFELFVTQKFGATSSSQSSYYVPVFTTILGAMFLNEIITGVMVIGMALMFLGIFLIQSKKCDISS